MLLTVIILRSSSLFVASASAGALASAVSADVACSEGKGGGASSVPTSVCEIAPQWHCSGEARQCATKCHSCSNETEVSFECSFLKRTLKY